MPEMDGFEATRTIRRKSSAVRNHDIPIIAMTAHAMTGDRERCIDAGMDDYVSKPIQPRDLAEAIERWILRGTSAQKGQDNKKVGKVVPLFYMKIAEYLSKAMMLRMPAIKRFLYSWSNQQFVVQSWQGSC